MKNDNIIYFKNPWAYLSQPRQRANPNAHLTREPSICRSRGGLVLHSANLRSTAFIADAVESLKVERAFKAARSTRARSSIVDPLCA